MSKDYFIRPYQQGDEEEIVNFLGLVFNGWPDFDLICPPIQHWKWKFLGNPTNKIVISLALSNDKIVGCFHNILKNTKIGDKIFHSSIGVDLAVHPDFRGLNISNEMRKFRNELLSKEGVEFVYGATGNPILIKTAPKRGNTVFPHESEIFVKIDSFTNHVTMNGSNISWYKKYGYYVIKILNILSNKINPLKLKKNDVNILKVNKFDDRINLFWEKIKNYYIFIDEINKEYLNWRYCDSRGGNYIINVAQKEDEILGYSVLRINKKIEEYPQGFIVDLLVIPDRIDVFAKLISNAVDFFKVNKVNIIHCFYVKNDLSKILGKYGFLDSRSRPYIDYPPLQENTGIYIELEKLHSGSKNRVHMVSGSHDWI